jgi:hypothetical protein
MVRDGLYERCCRCGRAQAPSKVRRALTTVALVLAVVAAVGVLRGMM